MASVLAARNQIDPIESIYSRSQYRETCSVLATEIKVIVTLFENKLSFDKLILNLNLFKVSSKKLGFCIIYRQKSQLWKC